MLAVTLQTQSMTKFVHHRASLCYSYDLPSCLQCSEYTIHSTRLQIGSNGFPVCIRQKDGEILQDIEDLGRPDLKFLFSPGAEKSPEMK